MLHHTFVRETPLRPKKVRVPNMKQKHRRHWNDKVKPFSLSTASLGFNTNQMKEEDPK
jgi:hypothetical protein